MATPQTFKAIDSTAADPSQPGTTTAAQVSTAHLQMARQNNRYLIEWRGPTTTFTWPSTEPVDAEEDPPIYPFPRLAYATWACFGPFRYFVPDFSTEAITTVDIDLFCSALVGAVRVSAFSLQGNRGQAPTSEWLYANHVIREIYDTGVLTLSNVQVRGGWNDIYLCEQSTDTNWSIPTDSWSFTDNFGTYPRIIASGGDLSVAAPPLLSSNVPGMAVRCGVEMDDKDAQFAATTPYTVAYSGLNSTGLVCEFIYLAELVDLSQIPTSVSLNDFGGGGVFYWAELGMLELYSLSITPYGKHPDKTNDPMLRWYQLTGSNVADVYWQASRLNDLRQTQVGSAKVPKQEFVTWPGNWLIERFTDVAKTTLVRDVALTVLTEQPTEAAGDVSIEVSLPAMLLDAAEFRPDSFQPQSGFLDVIIELFDLTAGAVVDTITLPSVNLTPRLSLGRTIDSTPPSFYWLRKMFEQRRGATWHGLRPNGQPWSHDMAVSLGSIGSTMTPITARLPLSITTWATLRTSGKIYSVRVSFTDNLSGDSGAILAVGPLTARIDWGTR